jgi:hypothetical protein
MGVGFTEISLYKVGLLGTGWLTDLSYRACDFGYGDLRIIQHWSLRRNAVTIREGHPMRRTSRRRKLLICSG